MLTNPTSPRGATIPMQMRRVAAPLLREQCIGPTGCRHVSRVNAQGIFSLRAESRGRKVVLATFAQSTHLFCRAKKIKNDSDKKSE